MENTTASRMGFGAPYEAGHRFEDGAVDLAKILTDKKLDGLCHAVESFASRREAFANVPKDVILVANGRLTKEGTKWSLSPERGRPEDLQTRRFPASFDPTAKAPKLLAWLDRMFAGRQDDVEACQKQAGACLIGKNPFKKFMIIEGNQDLGKGKLIALFQKLAGRECVETMRTQYLHERFETARYLGKTTITASDVPENFMSLPGTPMLKMITSIDELVPIEGKTKTSMGELMTGGFNVIVGTNFRPTEPHSRSPRRMSISWTNSGLPRPQESSIGHWRGSPSWRKMAAGRCPHGKNRCGTMSSMRAHP